MHARESKTCQTRQLNEALFRNDVDRCMVRYETFPWLFSETNMHSVILTAVARATG